MNRIDFTRKVMALAVCLLSFVAVSVHAQAGPQPSAGPGFKNVIMMIPDGCDQTVQTVARWYKGKALQLDSMGLSAVKTHMANSIITGSAAAGTAYATGHKTSVGFLGVGPRTSDLLTGLTPTAAPYAPVASVLEAAKQLGKATGIAVTSRVTHATPAAFASHVHDRGLENEIMAQMVYNSVDVVFGGGARHLIPGGETYTTSFGDTWRGKRTDGENLMQVLQARGYQFVDSKEAMARVTAGRVWGLFGDSHLQPDLDRRHFAPHEPSLSQMVDKAIALLSRDPDGFFLMVEGSQVDWAGHSNDPIYMTTDFIAFDNAVKVACDFAAENGETLVLVFPDHNTGGMTIGHYHTPSTYTATTVEDLLVPLKGMTMSANGVVTMMKNDTSRASLKAALQKYWHITATAADIADIRELTSSLGLGPAMARVISKNHTVIGWTTHGHNGETVPLWVYGGTAPVGTMDNTELAAMAARAMGTDLGRVTGQLYVDLGSVTTDYTIANEGRGKRTVRIKGAQLPCGKDYMLFNGDTIPLPGLTVYAPETDKVYLSRKALKVLQLI